MKATVLVCSVFSMALSLMLPASDAHAGRPRTEAGPCGSVLPIRSRRIAKNRYVVTYHRALSGILKMYGKVYGKKNPNYRMTRLFSLSNVVAYHLKSKSTSTRWAGLNITWYTKRRDALQIFVICRKR